MGKLEENNEDVGEKYRLISFIDEKLIPLLPHILIAIFVGIFISKLAGTGDAPGLAILIMWGAYVIIGVILYVIFHFIGFQVKKIFIFYWLFFLIINPIPGWWEASIIGSLINYPYLQPFIDILILWIYWIMPSIPLYLALHFLGEKKLDFVFRLYYIFMIFFLIGFFYGYGK